MPTARSDLERLVAFPTISSRPVTELASFLATRLEDLGFEVTWFHDSEMEGKANLVARIGPRGTDGLVLSGHMDVVPTENQPWTSDPFKVTEREGRLFGRGTADMKGFFAATLAALRRIEHYDKELVLIWTHDEEVGCLGSYRLADKISEPLPTQCLIGEPTDFRVLRMHPGHVAVEILIEGRAAHSSRPDLGLNAIDAAGDIIGAIREVARELEAEATPHPEIERNFVPVNLGTISGGSAVNIVADRCRLVVGYRPLPGMSSTGVFERIRERVQQLDLQAPVRLNILRDTPSLLTPADVPLRHLLEEHAAEKGTGCASFATDGGNLAKLGTQPLVFGPGSITVAHQADEYLEASALHRAVDVLESVIRTRCG